MELKKFILWCTDGHGQWWAHCRNSFETFLETYIPHFDRALFAYPALGWRGTSELLAWAVDGGRYRKQLEDLRLHRR